MTREVEMVMHVREINFVCHTGRPFYAPDWERPLLAGTHDLHEAAASAGPYTPCETRDDGTVHIRKRYLRLHPRA